jgi:hypothetical protein
MCEVLISYTCIQHSPINTMQISPNLTPLSTTVVPLPPPLTPSCEPAQFLSPLRPTVYLDPSGPGFAVGPVRPSVDNATGATTWAQDVSAFWGQPASLPARVLARAGAVALGEPVSFAIKP